MFLHSHSRIFFFQQLNYKRGKKNLINYNAFSICIFFPLNFTFCLCQVFLKQNNFWKVFFFFLFPQEKKLTIKTYEDYMHKRTMPKITFTNHNYKVGISKWHTSQSSGINVFKIEKENSCMKLWFQIMISVVFVPLKS